MDDIVRQAMAKWPNVPDCFGWLGLDARGNWYMRDDKAQAAGAFSAGFDSADGRGSLVARGSQLRHDKLIAFIERNYAADETGRWFFQNGPQRVFVELEATPWIFRVSWGEAGQFPVLTHTGEAALPQRSFLDEEGRLYLECNLGFGLVHTQDVGVAADAIESGLWVPEEMPAAAMPERFGYVKSPAKAGL